MAENEAENVGPQVPNEETATTETPSITAGDLRMMVNVIDAGSQRGAWKGEELATIGNLRTKLVAVVQAVAPQTEESTGESKETKSTDAA